MSILGADGRPVKASKDSSTGDDLIAPAVVKKESYQTSDNATTDSVKRLVESALSALADNGFESDFVKSLADEVVGGPEVVAMLGHYSNNHTKEETTDVIARLESGELNPIDFVSRCRFDERLKTASVPFVNPAPGQYLAVVPVGWETSRGGVLFTAGSRTDGQMNRADVACIIAKGKPFNVSTLNETANIAEIGDWVLFDAFSAKAITRNGERYVMLTDDRILGVMTDDFDPATDKGFGS